MASVDVIDKIVHNDPTWLRRHTMHAFLSYIRNNRRRGILVSIYANECEALARHDTNHLYIMDKKEAIAVANISCLDDVFDMYDADMQVVLLLIVGPEAYLQVQEYTMEETHEWMAHYAC